MKLGSKRASKDKEVVKVHYEIVLVTAENVVAAAPVYVQWKRGSKSENKGESKHVTVSKDKKAVFEGSVLSFDSTLYKLPAPKKGYEPKNISITLKEEKGKKGNSLAKTVIDLAEFAGKDERRSFSLKSKKSKVAPTLTLHFKSKERELAPGEDITETDGGLTEDNASDEEDSIEDFADDSRDDSSVKSDKSDKRASLSIGKSTSSAPSTPDKPRDSKRDSVANLGSLDTEQLRAELDKSKKRTKELATENVELEDKVKELTKELDDVKRSKASPGPSMSSDKEADLRKKIKDLTQENSDKEDLIKKLRKENDEKQVGSPGGLSAEKEAQMKVRLKELATENVDLEEQVNDLKKELEEVKAQGGKKGDREEGLQKQVQELNDQIKERDATILTQKQEAETHKQTVKERDNTILSQKQEVETLKQTQQQTLKEKDSLIHTQKQELDNHLKKSGDSKPVEKELNDRIKDRDNTILSQKQEIEMLKKSNVDVIKEKDGVITSLKLELKQSNESKSEQEELRKRIKELTRANEDTEEEVEALKKQVEQLKKSPAPSSNSNAQAEEVKRLLSELRDKDDKINDLEDELERLKRKTSSSSSSSDTSAVQEYKDKIDSLKEKLRAEQDENDRKLDEARSVESELRDRIRELEDAADSSKLKSSSSRDSSRQDKEKYEREIEKEKDARKKAEKELRDLRDKLEDLEEQNKGRKHASATNGKSSSGSSDAERELEREKAIVAAIYENTGRYSSDDGVSESAIAVWEVLSKSEAYNDSDDPEVRAVADRVVEVLQTASNCTPNDMNLLFYWLSTVSAVLHMLRDEPDAQSNNDRDPIIDGIYQPSREPSSSANLQDRLEWVAFSAYKQLVSLICSKLTPVLAPIIIEKPLTDKKTQVSTSSVMRILDRVLARTRNHYLYDAIVQQLFVQIFYFISCHLVNTILQKNKLTPTIGFQIKLGLSHLEDWLSQPSGSSAERALLAPCHAQLDGVRDVGGVLVLDKALLTDASTLQSIFKVLNLKQIKRLLEVFEPDQLAQGGLPPSVRDAMASTWGAPGASSLPLLFDQTKMLAFAPQFD